MGANRASRLKPLIPARRLPPRAAAWSPPPAPLERAFALSGLVILTAMNVALPSWGIGPYPARGMVAVLLLGLLSVFYTARLIQVFQQYMPIVQVAAILAALGTFLSVLNGAPAQVILNTLIEVHLQVLVTLLLAGIVAQICGMRACVLVLASVIAASGAVAVLQMLNVEAAWQARVSLGALQDQLREVNPYEKARPSGLSYSPIQLTTQLCLAFAVFAAWRERVRAAAGVGRTQDPAVLIALALLVFMSFASQTRSPLAGAFVFFAIYSLSHRGSLVPVLVAAAGAILYFAWPSLVDMVQSTQSRVVRVADDSVWNRFTLGGFGVRLFLDNPLGYGFAFDPSQLWMTYWREIYHLPGAGAVQSKELHNYFLNMANTYGIGLLLIGPLVVKLLYRARGTLLFFVPYLLHIAFHNVGPFWNDNIIWLSIAALWIAAPKASRAPQFAFVRRGARPGGLALDASWRGAGEPLVRPTRRP